jgi:hypothetical protein
MPDVDHPRFVFGRNRHECPAVYEDDRQAAYYLAARTNSTAGIVPILRGILRLFIDFTPARQP